MSQQVQELIDKIKTEGVQAAESKAAEIESQAQDVSGQIVNEAKSERQRIIDEAKAETDKLQESAEMAIKQAARDTLLTLRKNIQQTLTAIIEQDVRQALSPEQLGKILAECVKGYLKEGSKTDGIQVGLSKADAASLKSGAIKKLQEQLKKSIEVKSSEDIDRGFTISFDKGKSSFDFTDTSLAEYLTTYLNEEIASLLKDAVSTKNKY